MSGKNKQAGAEPIVLSPKEIRAAIKHMIPTGVSMFVWGPPGISKSAVARSIADELGVSFIDVRLSQMEPTDLRGIPYPVEEYNRTGVKWSSPLCLPRDLDYDVIEEVDGVRTFRYSNPHNAEVTLNVYADNEKHNATVESHETGGQTSKFRVRLTDENGNPVHGKVRWTLTGEVNAVLALEELNSAPPSVQAAAYQLLLDRRLGDEYVVPKGVSIICMGNRDTDKGVTYKMATAICNRLTHLEMKVKFEDWQEWAITNGIEQTVVGFLSAFPEYLHQFDPKSAERGFPTPRSWEFVSKIESERRNPNSADLSENVLLGLLAGTVGQSAALQYAAYAKTALSLPKPRDILDGKITSLGNNVNDDVSLTYALVYSLLYALRDYVKEMDTPLSKRDPASIKQEAIKMNDVALSFIMNNIKKPEMQVMAFHTAIHMKIPFIAECKMFKEFTIKHRDAILVSN